MHNGLDGPSTLTRGSDFLLIFFETLLLTPCMIMLWVSKIKAKVATFSLKTSKLWTGRCISHRLNTRNRGFTILRNASQQPLYYLHQDYHRAFYSLGFSLLLSHRVLYTTRADNPWAFADVTQSVCAIGTVSAEPWMMYWSLESLLLSTSIFQ